MGNSSTKKFVYVTLLAAMAISINVLESTFIPAMPFGIRFGLANIIALITIEMFGVKEMLIVNAMRVVIGSLLRGTIFGSTFWISLGGVCISSLVIIICKKLLKLPIISTSMLSAIGHSVGQVLMVSFIYTQTSMVAIIPYLLISAIPTGILTGYVSLEANKRLPRIIR